MKNRNRPDRRVAIALFIVYNIEAERFDKRICTGSPCADGSGKLPASTAQSVVINRHAKDLGKLLYARADQLGISRAQLAEGERLAQLMPYAQVEAGYSRSLRLIGGSLERPPAAAVAAGLATTRYKLAATGRTPSGRAAEARRDFVGGRVEFDQLVIDDPSIDSPNPNPELALKWYRERMMAAQSEPHAKFATTAPMPAVLRLVKS